MTNQPNKNLEELTLEYIKHDEERYYHIQDGGMGRLASHYIKEILLPLSLAVTQQLSTRIQVINREDTTTITEPLFYIHQILKGEL